MNVVKQHWGEIKEDKELEQIPDVSADVERSMNKSFLHEFNDDEEPIGKSEKIVVPPLNAHMLYTISLHKYWNNVADLIKLSQFTESVDTIQRKMPGAPQVANSLLNFSVQDFQNHAIGNEVEIPNLSKNVIQHILIKSVATIFAHFGYETSCQSALNVLVDVLQEFMQKICHQVKIAISDNERQFVGFPNIIERVLTETGIGGVRALNEHCQGQVLKYAKVVEDRCKDLLHEYQSLSVPKPPSPVDKTNNLITVKVEEDDVVEVENSEVHFTAMAGDLSILETGYQFLEVVENLPSPRGEDMSVSESPGLAPVSSEDMSHLSPFSKKKRLK